MESGMKWRWTALIIYLSICVFDFIIVPIWFGMMRPDYQIFLEEVRAIDDTMVQMELLKKLTAQHSPYTLQTVSYTHLTLPTNREV